MHVVERVVRRVDSFQRRNPVVGVPFALNKKFTDDRGPLLAALLAYYGVVSFLPLLLLLTTALAWIGNEQLEHSVVGSTLRQFPVVGEQIGSQVAHPLTGNPVALVVGVLGLLYGSLGIAQTAQHAMAEIWNVPGLRRPGFVPRQLRALAFFGVLGLGVAATAAVAALATMSGTHTWTRVLFLAASAALNAGLYVAAFRALTPRDVATADLVPGCVLGGVIWTAVLAGGTALVQHNLRHSQALYGAIGAVLGLVAWLYLSAQVALYAAELNVLLKRRLWPRSILQPPLTDADLDVLRAIAMQERRRPEQRLEVSFDDGALTEPTAGDAESDLTGET